MTLWSESSRDLAALFAFYGPVDVYRVGALAASAVTIGVFMPGNSPSREVLADLGGGRATKLGNAAPGTAIQDGDELRAAGHTWMVQGTQDTPEVFVMALSELVS